MTAVTVAVCPTVRVDGTWLPVMLRVWLYEPWQAPHGLGEVANTGDRNKRIATAKTAESSKIEVLCFLNTDSFGLFLPSAIFHLQ